MDSYLLALTTSTSHMQSCFKIDLGIIIQKMILTLNLTPENRSQHSRKVTNIHKRSSSPITLSKINARQIQ